MTIWRFTCHCLEETNIMRKLRIHKSRRAVTLPRRKSSQENQAPTLIIVKDFHSECFVDRAEQVHKTSALGSPLFFSQRQNIFRFKQSQHSSWCGPCNIMQTESPQACVMWPHEVNQWLLMPSHLQLLIMGPGENYLPSPRHCIFINIAWWS